jgi:glycosyltransferase involved in cell wall biosynthesis
MISALILTFNEEIILHQCLEALDFADEIVVFDSFSTDKTVAIAEQYGAKIFQRKFDNYAKQRNEALKSVSESSDWILMVDADEIVSTELKQEILKITAGADNLTTLFRVRRKDIFQNKWIKHSSGYPTWFGRLFKNGEVSVEREINEEYHTKGGIGHLQEHLIHYPFNKGIEWWFWKHNRYSSMEAKTLVQELNEKPKLKNLFSSDPTIRRKAQKGFSFSLPMRPFIVFIAFYFLRFGFLDGKAGYTFCKLRKTYEWMIDLKIKELKELNSKK